MIDACKDYLNKYQNKRSITVEYILIDGINDSILHAKKLTRLLSTMSCKINLIPFNSFKGSNYKRPTLKKINLFKDYLMNKGYITTLRIIVAMKLMEPVDNWLETLLIQLKGSI